MIYGADGRVMRRRAGFAPQWEPESEPTGEINVTACGFVVPFSDEETEIDGHEETPRSSGSE